MTLLASPLPHEISQVDPVHQGLLAVVNGTYDSIAAEGLDRDSIHRLPVCYQASSLIVSGLLDNGHTARHESITQEGIGAHSYVVVDGTNNEEIIIDATWQQFLPKDKSLPEDLPRVLVGERSEVMRQAREFGVAKSVSKVWEVQPHGIAVEEQQLRDRAAELASEEAAQTGFWEVLKADGQNTQPQTGLNQPGKIRRVLRLLSNKNK